MYKFFFGAVAPEPSPSGRGRCPLQPPTNSLLHISRPPLNYNPSFAPDCIPIAILDEAMVKKL